MFTVVLHQPEIPPNTGNIVRLCANAGCALHLVEPLGFHWTDKALQRAGLDYHEYATVRRHASLAACREAVGGDPARWFALTTRGVRRVDEAVFRPGDVFVFGSESRGLPPEELASFAPEHRLRLPMQPDRRSLNLANAAAVVVYEAWRQNGFAGGV